MGRDDNRPMDQTNNLSGIARLGYFGCIRVSGADSNKFLQSQFTNDFSRLEPGRARLAGFCSAKGRLQASFVGWQTQSDEVMLICSADLLTSTLKRLAMFVLRLKCKLTDASQEAPVHGLAGSAATRLLGSTNPWQKVDSDQATAICLPSGAGQALAFWIPHGDAPVPHGPEPALDAQAWRWLHLNSGVPFIEAKTADLFVPQMINFELLGGVDFQKGCYPGQEVVARSQYRGTLKRRMFLFECREAAIAGQEIFSSVDPGQPAGVVANAAVLPGQTGCALLAEVKLHALNSGTLHLAQPAGPVLTQRALPYNVPTATDSVN